MRNSIRLTAFGAALLAGPSLAHAQTVVTETGRYGDRSATRCRDDATGPNSRNCTDRPVDYDPPPQGSRPASAQCDDDANNGAQRVIPAPLAATAPVAPALQAIAQPGYTEVVQGPRGELAYPLRCMTSWARLGHRLQQECWRSPWLAARLSLRFPPIVTSTSLTVSWSSTLTPASRCRRCRGERVRSFTQSRCHRCSATRTRCGILGMEKAMKQIHDWIRVIALVGATATAIAASVNVVAAQTADIDEVVNANGVAPKLELTDAQKSAIYQAVHKEKSKVAPSRFATNVGADVPPMIELYALPDEILANNPATKFYKFTRVENQVVLVDPTKMRIMAVIGSAARR